MIKLALNKSMRVSDDEQGINKLAILGGDMEKYWEEIWSG